jgi:hypothetical protein
MPTRTQEFAMAWRGLRAYPVATGATVALLGGAPVAFALLALLALPALLRLRVLDLATNLRASGRGAVGGTSHVSQSFLALQIGAAAVTDSCPKTDSCAPRDARNPRLRINNSH